MVKQPMMPTTWGSLFIASIGSYLGTKKVLQRKDRLCGLGKINLFRKLFGLVFDDSIFDLQRLSFEVEPPAWGGRDVLSQPVHMKWVCVTLDGSTARRSNEKTEIQ